MPAPIPKEFTTTPERQARYQEMQDRLGVVASPWYSRFTRTQPNHAAKSVMQNNILNDYPELRDPYLRRHADDRTTNLNIIDGVHGDPETWPDDADNYMLALGSKDANTKLRSPIAYQTNDLKVPQRGKMVSTYAYYRPDNDTLVMPASTALKRQATDKGVNVTKHELMHRGINKLGSDLPDPSTAHNFIYNTMRETHGDKTYDSHKIDKHWPMSKSADKIAPAGPDRSQKVSQHYQDRARQRLGES